MSVNTGVRDELHRDYIYIRYKPGNESTWETIYGEGGALLRARYVNSISKTKTDAEKWNGSEYELYHRNIKQREAFTLNVGFPDDEQRTWLVGLQASGHIEFKWGAFATWHRCVLETASFNITDWRVNNSKRVTSFTVLKSTLQNA